MAAKLEIGDTITTTKIHKLYWFGASYELVGLDFIKAQPRKRGAVSKFTVLRELPTGSLLRHKTRNKYFTAPIADWVSDACSTIEEIKDEMTDWRDNLEQNEGLNQTSKADEVRDAADQLEYVETSEIEDIPEFMVEQEKAEGKSERAALMVELSPHLPTVFTWRAKRKRTGRTSRLSDACAILEACADTIINHLPAGPRDDGNEDWTEGQQQTAEDYAQQLQSTASELDGVDCPGMY